MENRKTMLRNKMISNVKNRREEWALQMVINNEFSECNT